MLGLKGLLGRCGVRGMSGVVGFGLTVLVLVVMSASAQAATRTVTTTADADNGSCTASQCTLRDAVKYSSPGDTVVIPAGTYTLTLGELAVDHALTINGAGANQVTISGNDNSRVFNIGDVTVSISGVTVTHGSDSGSGGGIFLSGEGTLTLANSTISNSTAGDGGGIDVDGTATITGTTINDNHAPQFDSCACGGGVEINGTLNMANSTITGNTAGEGTGNFVGGDGGGVYDNGDATFKNVTIASNTVTAQQFSLGTAGFQPSTAGANVSVNDTSSGGFENTIIANPIGGENCDTSGVFPTSQGHNLEDDAGQSCQFSDPSDKSGVNPKLGPLADNGGPTQTMALLSGSPAIDAGATISAITTDQRGVPRPQGSAYDIGAFEVAVNADLALTKSGSPNPVTVGKTLTYTLGVTNNGPAAASGVTVTDTLPSSVSFNSASASQGSCSHSGSSVTCNLGNLAAGGSASVTIAVTPNTPGTITNTASVSSSAPDPNSGNNSASASTQVQAAAVGAAAGTKPLATTGNATGIGFTVATIHGQVNPEGAATTYFFEYGTTTHYGSKTASQSAGSGTTFRSFSHGLSGLRPGTLYHYRIVAQNANGTANGADRTFRTPRRPTIHVNPNRVEAGKRVRVFGNAGACRAGDRITLISQAFPGTHEFAGVPAISTTVRSGGKYSTTTRVPASRHPGHYIVTARCGGGNLGVSARLTVFTLPRFTG